MATADVVVTMKGDATALLAALDAVLAKVEAVHAALDALAARLPERRN